MFDFLKPKLDAAEAGTMFAAGMPTLLTTFDDSAVNKELSEMVAAGASNERIRPELSAYLCFLHWLAMSALLQRGKISVPAFERMMDGYYEGLESFAGLIPVEDTGSLAYSTYWEWLQARLHNYITISTTSEPAQAHTKIVESFCDFVCDGEPSAGLKLKVLTTYHLFTGRIYDQLVGSRWY